MASRQRRQEHDYGERKGEQAVQVHRGGRTKGEHLGAKGYQETKAYQEMERRRSQTEEQHGTGGGRSDQMGRGSGARGDPSVQEGIDIDASTG